MEKEEDTRGVVRFRMPPDEKPKMEELHKYLVKYCDLWRPIGLKLGLEDDLLETISKDNSKQQECFRVMLQKWLKQDISPTWTTLELAVTNAQRNELSLDNLPKLPKHNTWSVKAVQAPDGDYVDNRETTHDELLSPKKNDSLIVNPSKAITEFVSIVGHIEEILTKNNEVENLKAIKSTCAYLPISKSSKKPMFTGEQLKEIDACKNIQEVLRQLRFHLRWDDHLILAAILDRIDSEECEELLGRFQSKIDCQMKLEQIFKECKKQELEVPKEFVNMVAIVNKKYSRITKEEYDQLKCFIAEHCGIELYVLSPFLNMSPSSVLLEWLVPSTAITHMVETATKHKHIFINNSFIFLKIENTVVLDIKREEPVIENELSKQLNHLVGFLSLKDREATLSTLRRIFDNVIQCPNDDKYRQIRLANERFSSKVWQYPAGKELMKTSGWVVEGDHVRLRDDSCVRIVSQLLKSLCEQQHTKHISSSTATGIVPIPLHVLQILVQMLLNGHTFLVQMLLEHINISPSGRVYAHSGSSVNLLVIATIGQQLDIIKLLLHDYSVDPYAISVDDKIPFLFSTFSLAPQSFIIDVLKCCGVKSDFKVNGVSLLHGAVFANCFDVVQFLKEECKDIDVNITDHDLQTPLHKAYLAGHTQIAQYLIQNGADINAVDKYGNTPYQYIEGAPESVSFSQYLRNKRIIHHNPFSTEQCYYRKCIHEGISDKEAVFLTMEQFPSLKEDGPTQPQQNIGQEDGPTQPQQNIGRAVAVKEFTEYITKGLSYDKPWRQPLSEEQRHHVIFST